MDWLFIVGLAIASSVDNLAVGLSYGLSGRRIGLAANLVIAAICFIFSQAGLLAGGWIGAVLPGTLPDFVGAALLILIGLRILLLLLPSKKKASMAGRSEAANDNQPLGRAKRPDIGFGESIVLGAALSANALANAVGAGILGLSTWAISFSTSAGSLIAIAIGVELGFRALHIRFGRFDLGRIGTALSGAILVVLAVARFVH